MKLLISFLVSLSIFGCCSEQCDSKEKEKIDFGKLPFKNQTGNITAVIEIPAGTNHKYEYDYEAKDFVCEIRDGKPRVVKFIPYVGNYGFIPGTYMDPSIGGDGDALDVLVLCESIPQGTIVEIKPIATLKLLDHDEEDHKIIAVPTNSDQNLMNVNSYEDLTIEVKSMIKTWFTSYKGPGKMKFISWESDSSTMGEILKWKK